ncbi:MAG: hypothetical protein RLZZ459_2043 [Cyanobacteriota bacterium]|jgi:hypothetical protein
MNTIKSIALSDWGPHIECAARVTAAVLAFAATLLVLAAELAYDLGRLLRQALEARNDQLAAAWRTLLVGVTTEPVVVPVLAIAPAPAPAPAPARRSRKTTRKARA